ncbi:MAG: histidine phosphatase family protein [Alphaproteobacteria bacterium]
MVKLAIIRHGPTRWTEEKRLQGRRDTPLSPDGRRIVERWRLPPELAAYRWISSPLMRCVETARILGAADLAIEPRLIEMDWGAWEGRRSTDLRVELGPELTANERRGLDLRPPAGESPREVLRRVTPWLREIADHGRPTLAFSHKGVIRAIYALAAGWDMRAEMPHKLSWDSAQCFDLDIGGKPRISVLNVALSPRSPAHAR